MEFSAHFQQQHRNNLLDRPFFEAAGALKRRLSSGVVDVPERSLQTLCNARGTGRGV